ncbi:MAG: glucose-1-phosphate thymidylyltransferase [Chloroflexi bacterium]|nr:glucose-1-phosphate thymidylyltransferase [Chloroflexota bacterium]
MMLPEDFFDLSQCGHQELFQQDEPVWTVLDRLQEYITSLFQGSWPLAGHTGMVEKSLVISNGEVRDDLIVRPVGPKQSVKAFEGNSPLEDAAIIMPGAYLFDDRIIIGVGSVVEPGALIKGPVVIGARTEVRQGAYMRGDCLIGDGCVVGHTTEIKNSVMLNGAKAGHFAYIGDSILGRDVNLGAGTKLANLKMIPGEVMIAAERKFRKTGRRKLGAILGDGTETGCNSVTSPGTLIRPGSVVYSGVAVPGGYYEEGSCIMPSSGSVVIGSIPHRG